MLVRCVLHDCITRKTLLKMGSTVRNHLFLCLVFFIGSCNRKTYLTAEGAMVEKPSCFFPSFLQESCSQPSKICRHWLQVRRLENEGNNAFYGNVNTERSGELSWIFKGGKVQIVALKSSPSWIYPQEFRCWEKRAPHVFIILSKKATNKNDTRVRYSCIKFRKRGRNVVEYQQSRWRENSSGLTCNSRSLITNVNPLILSNMQELPSCPAKLNGGFQIMQLYNGKTDERCFFNNDNDTAIFESDCLGMEGVIVQLPLQRNCSLRSKKSEIGLDWLRFLYYSAPWKDNQFTYFIVKRQKFGRKVSHDSKESVFLCARFQRADAKGKNREIQVEFFDQPTCWRNLSAASIFLRIQIRKRMTFDQSTRDPSELNKTQCTFPKNLQGIWSEKSQQNKLRMMVINETMVDISPYGRFHCKDRYFFQHQAPYKCSSVVTEKWPGTGRARFHLNDYLLLSNFSNGCRSRITRFGVTEAIGNDVLIYRLSQSVPVERKVKNSDVYFKYHILKQFCSSWLPYIKDPYPIWGRNIEKIAMKNPTRIKRPCLLPALGKGIYHFKSMYADQDECSGPSSRLQFGCESSLTFKVRYDPSCRKPNLSLTCVGKILKIGEFSLVQDLKSKITSCVFFDKEKNHLFRLNSTQCSDLEWGKRPWEERNFAEKFVLQYYGKCPFTAASDSPVTRMRNGSHDCRTFLATIVSTCFLTKYILSHLI